MRFMKKAKMSVREREFLEKNANCTKNLLNTQFSVRRESILLLKGGNVWLFYEIQTTDDKWKVVVASQFPFRCFQFYSLTKNVFCTECLGMEGWMRCHIKIFLVAFEQKCIFLVLSLYILPEKKSPQVLPVPLANFSVKQAALCIILTTCFSLP